MQQPKEEPLEEGDEAPPPLVNTANGNGVDDDDDDDDPIVAEYDVFLSQQLCNRTHIFQYPLRPADRPYEGTDVKLEVSRGVAPSVAPPAAAQVKTEQIKREYPDDGDDATIGPTARFLMTTRVNAYGCPRIDMNRRSEVGDPAIKEEEDAGSENPHFSYQLGSVPFKACASYAVGVLLDGELHLTPVSTIQQFCPVVKSSSAAGGRGGKDPANPEGEDPRLVSSINVAATSNLGAMQSHLQNQLRKTRSYTLRADSDTRRYVDFFRRETVDSRAIAQRLICATLTSSKPATSGSADGITPEEVFFPLDTTTDPTAKVRKNILLRYSAAYRLEDQVKDILSSTQVIALSTLMELVRGPNPEAQVSEAMVLSLLQRYAVCIHGLWVAVYNMNFTGNAAALREYILLHFAKSQSGCVTRNGLLSLLPPDPAIGRTVLAILKSLAILLPEPMAPPAEAQADFYKYERQWQLRGLQGTGLAELRKLSEDKYSAETKQQKAQWIRRAEEIEANIESIRMGKTIITRQLRLTVAPTLGDGSMGRSSQQLAAGTSPTGTRPSAGPNNANNTKEQQITQARQYIRNLYAQCGVINKELMKERLKQLVRQRNSPIENIRVECLQLALQAEVTNAVMEGTWMLKSVDPLTDQYRKHIVAAMRETPTFIAKDLGEKANALFTRELTDSGQGGGSTQGIPQSVLTKTISELAEYKGGERLWHAKTGVVNFQMLNTTTPTPLAM